jgi:O-antigen/teichoic acid export membrane protein
MSILRSLVRNSTLLLVGTACAKALVLVATLILGRRLGPEGFGLYSLVFAYLAFFELFADAGLDALLVRDLARAPTDGPRRLGDALVLRALLLVAVVPVAAALFPSFTHRPDGALLVVLGGAALVSSNRRSSLRTLVEAPYRARLDMGVPTVLGVLAEALHVGILAVLIARAGVPGAVSAQTLASLPFFALLAFLSARRLRPEIRFDGARLRGLLWTAAPLLGGLAVNVVLARADAVMLQVMRGTRDVGLYTAPVRIVEIANLLPILLMTSVFPLFAASHPQNPTRVDRLFRGSLRTLVTALVPFVAAQIVFAAPLIERLFGMPYAESIPVLPALALSEIFVFCDIVLTSRLVATGAERRNFGLLGIAAAANVGANLWLIPHWGPRGAAEANLFAYAVRLVAGFAFRDVRATSRIAVFAILPALGAGLVAFAPSILLAHHRIVAFALGLAVYPVALYLVGGLSLQDLVHLRSALRSAAATPDVGRGGDGA